MGVPKGFGGGKVDSGCIHDGNREGLSRNYELHEQHVGFYVHVSSSRMKPSLTLSEEIVACVAK